MQPPRYVGRYAVYGEISSGGMGSVHYGRLLGPVGFSRTVAIKRLHPQFAKDPEFVAMFIDEARLAARVRHPNVVQTTDVVALDEEVFLVMDFVQGEALSKLERACREAGRRMPLEIVSSIVVGMLHGLHAAHEATNERGESLQIVHRDVSPQNVLVGVDGVVRVLDFGVAKAAGRAVSTRDGQIKGKIAYMSPEQLRAQKLDRRSDVFAAGVVLWEALTGERLFAAESEGAVVANVLERAVKPPSDLVSEVPKEIDAIVLQALDRDPSKRFATAEAMALALESAAPVASASRVARFVRELAGEAIDRRAKAIAAIEEASDNVARARESLPRLDPSDVVEAEPTQPSSMSVSAPATRKLGPPKRSPVLVAVAIGSAVALAIIAILFGLPAGHARTTASATQDLAMPSLTVSAAKITASAVVPSASPSAAETHAPEPVATQAEPETARPASHATATATTKNCGVRTYFDSAGIKHYASTCP